MPWILNAGALLLRTISMVRSENLCLALGLPWAPVYGFFLIDAQLSQKFGSFGLVVLLRRYLIFNSAQLDGILLLVPNGIRNIGHH